MTWTNPITSSAASPMAAGFGVPSRAAVKAQQQTVLSTYQGPGRAKVLGWLEAHGHVPGGVTEAAKAGTSPVDIGRAVHTAWQQQLAAGLEAGASPLAGAGAAQAAQGGELASDALEVANVAGRGSVNAVYGGLIGQLYGARGFAGYVDPALAPAVREATAEAAPVAEASQQAARVVAETTQAGHAVAETAAAVHVATASGALGAAEGAAHAASEVHPETIAAFTDAFSSALKLLHRL
jgi:hypothetical protein